ncbi:hypothetical protein OPT61_g10708 [Boeremia exigua]|uniref:Uncharacterized protein n=1 Tax=Boeremia exigua TaxID=749465 RepID=A0ACC2HND7_9PLEO|nr:hypothetical protein OPT61_g10708 [Boeremia exigua]
MHPYRAGSTQERNQRRLHHIRVNPDAPNFLTPARDNAAYVRRRLGVLVRPDRVLRVIHDVEFYAEAAQGVGEGGNSAVARALDFVLLPVDFEDAAEDAAEVGGFAEARVALEVVGVFEEGGDFGGEEFAAEVVGFFLHDLGEGDLETPR